MPIHRVHARACAGFEPLVLEALRPLWPRMEDVVVEVQPGAWHGHGIGFEAGLATFRELVVQRGYRVVTLPRTTREERVKQARRVVQLDVCSLPVHIGPPKSFRASRNRGIASASVYNATGLEYFLRNVLAKPEWGRVHEFLLTTRKCP
jgi:hypothetical protein